MTTTRVTSPFGFESTAAEVIAGIDLHDRRALVTGAAGGIGVETARALASASAETVIAARDLAAAERTAADISQGETEPSRWPGSTCSTAAPSTSWSATSRARCTSWSTTPG